MADDALLSDLCSICNNAKFKYTCPGCAARTCSLPCYKRHQQWAQCTGKRDPTKYVKKSQLATPAGIDHDFNFLTGIERGLERAQKNVDDRGLGTPTLLRQDTLGRQPADQHYAAAGVSVIRAPKGMSRQRDNKTHRAKKKGNIIWTVEWIRDDRTRILTESTAVLPVLQLQPFRPDKASKKRKREAEGPQATKGLIQQDTPTPIGVEGGEFGAKLEFEEQQSSPLGLPGLEQDTAATTAAYDDGDAKLAGHDHTNPDAQGPESESVPFKYSFFLLRPRTSSSRHVLIPLDPTITLADSLRGRTVLEFPTIYVFPIDTTPPPEEFMLEQEYIKQEGEEQKEFEDLIKDVSPETLHAINAGNQTEQASAEIDNSKIIDVLKEDMKTRV